MEETQQEPVKVQPVHFSYGIAPEVADTGSRKDLAEAVARGMIHVLGRCMRDGVEDVLFVRAERDEVGMSLHFTGKKTR